MAPEQNALARLLQERREAAGYSRARLAALVGISAGSIEGWELGRVERPPFHEVTRIAAFLGISADELQRAVFADAGAIPDRGDNPGQVGGKKPGRKKSRGAVPLLEAAFRLYAWQNEDEAARALGTTGEQVRSWRRGRERMDVADYMALTTIVNVALADAIKTGKTHDLDLSGAAEMLGVSPKR
jgi:transcriptional regulator with XRE-family HTH domain